jgi:IS66 Orf2 like protein
VFGLGPATRIYLAAGVTDMRKGFEGLYGLVRDRLSCEPLSGHLFLFCNAQRNRLKGSKLTIFLLRIAALSIAMKTKKPAPKKILAIRCPTCGAGREVRTQHGTPPNSAAS